MRYLLVIFVLVWCGVDTAAEDESFPAVQIVKHMPLADVQLGADADRRTALISISTVHDPAQVTLVAQKLQGLTFAQREFDIFGLGELCRIRIGHVKAGEDANMVTIQEFVISCDKRLVYTADYSQVARLEGDEVYIMLDQEAPAVWHMHEGLTNLRSVVVDGEAPAFKD